MLLRKVMRDLSQRKLRCFLTIIGLGIAVVSITGFAIATDSILETSRRMLGANTANAFIMVQEGKWNQTFVEDIDYIYDFEPTCLFYYSTEIDDEYSMVYMNGIDMSKVNNGTSVAGVVLDEGSLPNPYENEILFDYFAAKVLDVQLGESIKIIIPTASNPLRAINFTITGFAHNVRYLGFTFQSGFDIWMNLPSLQTLTERADYFDILFLKISEEGNRLAIQDEIANRMEEKEIVIKIRYGYYSENFSNRIAMMETINILVIFVTIIGLVIGVLLTVTTIQMAIATEKEDIALLKIIGGKKRQIFTIYLLEAFIFGLLGSLFGLAFSILGAFVLIKIMANPLGITNIVFKISIKGIFLGLLIPIVTTVLFSLPTIFSVFRISPLEAFRLKTSIKNKKGKSKSVFIPFRYSFSNLNKKKIRLTLNVIMISLAISTIVGIQVTSHSVTSTINGMYSNFPGDIRIDTPENENESNAKIVLDSYFQNNSVDEIDSYECFWWLGGGCYDEVIGYYNFINLLGIHIESYKLNQFELIEGSLLTEADEGKNHIVISKILKEKIMQTEISIGSEVILIRQQANETFKVIGIINDQYDEGRLIYMPLSTMHRFLGVEGSERINTIYIELKDQTKDIEIANIMRKEEIMQAQGWLFTPISYERENSMRTANFFILLGIIVIILCVIVAIIGGTNSFSMAALDREREIGILKLIGAKPKWIISSFLIEGVILGSIAGFIGTIIGSVILARVLCILISNEFLMDILNVTQVFPIVIGVCSGILIGFLSAIYPGYKASITTVKSALKYE